MKIIQLAKRVAGWSIASTTELKAPDSNVTVIGVGLPVIMPDDLSIAIITVMSIDAIGIPNDMNARGVWWIIEIKSTM